MVASLIGALICLLTLDADAVPATLSILLATILLAGVYACRHRNVLEPMRAAASTPQSWRAYLATRGIDVVTRDMPHTHVTLAMVRA